MKKNWSIIVTLFVLAVILPTHANAATEVTTLPQLEAALGRDETEIIIKNDIQLSTALTIHTDVTMHSDENGPYRISIDADERLRHGKFDTGKHRARWKNWGSNTSRNSKRWNCS